MRSFIGRKTSVAAFVVLIAASVNYYRNTKTLSPIVEIGNGKLQGVVSYSRAGKEVYEYLQIPFSKPPVGDLRFEPPQPAEPWVAVRDATEVGEQCLQVNMITAGIDGSEDCLFLNVYTPKERKGLLPVMVWIHGGAFVFGSANRYKGAYLLDQEVILVTVNYRLAALGFLNTADGIIRGNMGLKDQNMAFQWVQENIKHFGGDSSNVAIFGESAGGASVGFHLVSPMSNSKLFTRAIIQSGSPLGNWAINREPAAQAKRFAKKFNCSETDPKEMVTCLKNVDGHTLVAAHREMLLPLREKITLFVPTIETVHDKNAFLIEEPLESLMSGRVSKVPLIIGVNEEEGLLTSSIITANETKLRQANDDWYFYAPRILSYDPEKRDVSDKIRNYYFGKTEDIGTIALISNYTNLFSDRQFFVPVHRFVKLYAKYAPVRMYLYSYSAEFSLGDMLAATQSERLPALASVILDISKRWAYRKIFRTNLPHLGVCHGDELQLLFNWPLSAFVSEDHDDFEMSKQMVKLWGDFVKNSDSISINKLEWPAIDPKSAGPLQYLNINLNPKMVNEPFAERIKFWDSLGL